MVLLALLARGAGRASAQNVARWSWREPQAKVLPTGDLEWAPQAFEFKPGESSATSLRPPVMTPTTAVETDPWKQPPGDPSAGGKSASCKGVQTYVFKQGTVYRGEIHANESGTAGAPIIFTRDPSWAKGRLSSAVRRW